MPEIIGVHLRDDEVCFMRLVLDRDKAPQILGELKVPRASIEPTADGEEFVIPESVIDFLKGSEDRDVVAVFDPKRFVTERTTFPFKDPRKIEQIAKLQLEEELPFEIDDFSIEVILGTEDANHEFPALIFAVANDEIREQLDFLDLLELDPVVLTPAVIGLSGLISLLPEGNFSLFAGSKDRFSFLTMRGARLVYCRDHKAENEEATLGDLLPTLLSATKTLGGSPELFYSVERRIRLDVEGLRTELLTSETLGIESNLAQLDVSALSVLGVCAARTNRTFLSNLRKGEFRYKGSFKTVFDPLWDERKYIAPLFLFLFVWLGSTLYAEATKRSLLDARIGAAIQKVFPGEIIPDGNELEFVDSRTQELEARLKGLGTVSALSPLEALRELSQTVQPGIDLSLDSISVTPAGVTFGGTVADTGTVGRLIGVLEKRQEKFCTVKVDPRGPVPGGTRIRVVAELTYCQ